MQIAVIGAGNVGEALGRGWARAGHEVVFGVREPGDARFEALSREPGIRVATIAEAAAGSAILVLAMPWQAVEEVLREVGDVAGRILIDCTNPLRMGAAGLELALGYEVSGAERIAALAPGARVCKAFNTTGYGNMENPVYDGRRAVMFVCGDDAVACKTVGELSDALGFETILAGGQRRRVCSNRWRCSGFNSPSRRPSAGTSLSRCCGGIDRINGSFRMD